MLLAASSSRSGCCSFFLRTATTDLYTLSLHDALPISSTRGSRATSRSRDSSRPARAPRSARSPPRAPRSRDRKSTRLNSSHRCISYAVFCLKKKKDESRDVEEALDNDRPGDQNREGRT